MYVPIWEEDRTELDGLRVRAYLIDVLVVAPVLIPLALVFGSLNGRVWLIYAACSLTYFHVLETRTGQTLGKRRMNLRVVSKDDAGPASAKAISIRTVLRLLDALPSFYIVGLITMVATRKRRQRLGDLAAGTVVTRASARPYTPARRSPLVTIYPMVWIGAAVAIALLIGRSDERFLAQIDSLCRSANQQMNHLGPSRTLESQIAIRAELERRIAALHAPTQEAGMKQGRILSILDADLQIAYAAIRHYQLSASVSQFKTETDALVASSEEHSAQLSREFGLGSC